jgi:translation initiation factor 3 subunit E
MAAAAHDLTPTIGRYLDRHLLIPLLDFLAERALFPKAELEQSKVEVVSKTNMLDYALELHAGLHGANKAPAEMKARRDEVMATMGTLQEEVRSAAARPRRARRAPVLRARARARARRHVLTRPRLTARRSSRSSRSSAIPAASPS